MADLTRLDRLISYFSPSRGAQRLAARRMMEALSYEGARKGRREKGWVTGSETSANWEISSNRLTLRDRVRDLRRNNPHARKAIAVLVSNRIGTGILAAADGPNKRLNARVNDAWERWIERCDYTGKTDYYGLQALAEAARIESGECFIRFTRVEPESIDDIGLRLQVLEPDHLDTTRYQRGSSGREIIEGIEYENRRPVAYWLHPTHPGDIGMAPKGRFESVRVPASEVIHYYRVERPGQLTGVTEMASVIRRLYDLDGYEDAELMRKKIAACMVGAVTTPSGLPASSIAPTEVGSDGRRTETFAPGMINYLKPGEQMQFHDPKPSEGYEEFNSVELHAIAAGLNMPYELLTGDLSEVTYTSHRGGLVQFRASVESDQWQLVIPQISQRVWDRFVTDFTMRPVRIPAAFTPPRFGLLDPAKEIPAMIESIQGGLQSWTDTIRREGENPDKVLDEIERERKEFERRGINVTSIVKPPAPTPPSGGNGGGPMIDDDEEAAA